MRNSLIILIVVFVCSSFGPPNCTLYKDDQVCFLACQEAEKAIMHGQGSRLSQQHFDSSISHCPTFAYSYYEKSVPYAKRGLVSQWKEMIDQAVTHKPSEYLGIRGWYHFYFMHNYEYAIRDIEALDSLVNYDIGFTGDGVYHLNVLKAICYRELGQYQKAIDIMEEMYAKEGYAFGLYDYLHLGVAYLKNGQVEKALAALEQQKQHNDVSEVYYYQAMAMTKDKNEELYYETVEKALAYYNRKQYMHNAYRQLPDRIYRQDIVDLLNER